MDYNKRRWLERLQQQQEEEPRDVYPITHTTYFSKDCGYRYTAIVEVYSKHTIIDLYKTSIKKKINTPFWVKVLLKLLDDKPSDGSEPLCNQQRISNNDSVSRTIFGMIVEYEIPLYQKWMAKQMDEELKIEYDVELGKRRQRLVNIDKEPQTHEEATPFVAPPINDFFAPKSEEEEQEEDPKKKSGYNDISRWNLKQNQNRKKFG